MDCTPAKETNLGVQGRVTLRRRGSHVQQPGGLQHYTHEMREQHTCPAQRSTAHKVTHRPSSEQAISQSIVVRPRSYLIYMYTYNALLACTWHTLYPYCTAVQEVRTRGSQIIPHHPSATTRLGYRFNLISNLTRSIVYSSISKSNACIYCKE